MGLTRTLGLVVLVAASMVLIGNSAQGADPKATVSAASGYVAGTPPKAKPFGTFTLDKASVAGDEYRVLVDYGTLALNTFTLWSGPAEYEAGISTSVGSKDYTWGPCQEQDLTGAPSPLTVRARVEWRPANNVPWKLIGVGYTPGGGPGSG
jgi:hypothetical protein